MKRVVILHTTPVTIPSIGALIKERSKDITVFNLLDDSILPEINEANEITDSVRQRLFTLLSLTGGMKADAVLCACSSIGGVIEEGRDLLSIPVLRIDEPMAIKAVASAGKIGVAATLPSTVLPTSRLLAKKAELMGKAITLESRVIEGAGSLLAEGREAEYDNKIKEALTEMLQTSEIVVLAQASMARAIKSHDKGYQARILTSPASGVEALCKAVGK